MKSPVKMRHALYIIAYFLTLAAGLAMGYAIGKNTGERKAWQEIQVLKKKLARFEDPQVFHRAEKVARITRTSVYQVLTGKLE